jgi:Tfp pilus assembly protein PilN
MNLQVDLMFDSERRSASVLNLKALGRIAAITVPVLLLITVATTVVRHMLLKNELAMLEEQWDGVAPKQKQATQMQVQYIATQDMRNEMSGWSEARQDWRSFLSEMQGLIPHSIRLETLNISQDMPLLEGKTAARAFRMFVRGRATGRTSESDIPALRRSLEAMEAVTSADVTRFGADMSGGSDRFDRVFQIDCVFEPKRFR